MNAHLQGASAENLLEEVISYNKQCYKNFTNKIHNGRVKATYEKGKRAATGLHPSLNERRQEDHLPLVYLNPRQHLRSIPKITISTNINASSAKKSQEDNFTMFQQRTWMHRSGKLVRRRTVEV